MMKNFSQKGLLLLFAWFTIGSFQSILGQNGTSFKIKVQIDYETLRPSLDTIITSNRPLTALEALQYAARVETNHVGTYVFVTGIDDTKGQRGVMAWYYEVNGQPSKTLAINAVLKSGDILRWIYTKDVCSGKVDQPVRT